MENKILKVDEYWLKKEKNLYTAGLWEAGANDEELDHQHPRIIFIKNLAAIEPNVTSLQRTIRRGLAVNPFTKVGKYQQLLLRIQLALLW